MIKFRGTYPAYDDGIILTSASNPILPEIDHDEVKIPHRAGIIELWKSHNAREISLKYELNGKSAARNAALAAQLARWAESTEAGQMVFDEMPDRFYLARLISATAPDYAQPFPTVTLKFLCANPYAFATQESSANVGSLIIYEGDVRAYPLITYTTTANQNGALWQCGAMRLEISGYTIPAGHTVTIDNANHLITDNGVNIMRYLALASDWIYIERGGVTINGTGGVITWRNIYL